MVNPIRTYRLKKHLTQEELAERARLSVRTVQRAEAGSVSPSWDSLEAMARVLEVSPEKLTVTYEMSEGVKAALRKIYEGMRELGDHFFDHPEEIDTFGGSHGTYVFQPLNLEPELHALICSETLPFHHAHLMEMRQVRPEKGENPDGSGEPWIRWLHPGPTVSAVIDVTPWRPTVWKATGSFTLVNERGPEDRRTGEEVDRIEVKEGDIVRFLHGDWPGYSLLEFGKATKYIRVGNEAVWSVFEHEKLPVVAATPTDRGEWVTPKMLR